MINMEIIIGWTLYKVYWEKLKSKDTLIIGDEKNLDNKINKMVDDGYKINQIEFIYVRET